MLSELNNIERISETLDADYHKLQHFITESNWDARKVIDEVAINVNSMIPQDTLTGLLIDESGWVKKGTKSIGVGHQYCGNVGKTANSQVAVFGCLCNKKYASLVDARLYLPKSWTSNKERCIEAGIPPEESEFKTKPELALEIVKHQLEQGISFDYVGADGLYGNDTVFAKGIDNLGLIYMLDIHSTQQVYLEKPELYLPERKSSKGRTPTKLKADMPSIAVKDYIETLNKDDWELIKIRHSAKGMIKGSFHFAKVYIWDKNINSIEQRLLVISKRQTKNGEEIKYSFTNASLVQYTEKAIAQMQATLLY